MTTGAARASRRPPRRCERPVTERSSGAKPEKPSLVRNPAAWALRAKPRLKDFTTSALLRPMGRRRIAADPVRRVAQPDTPGIAPLRQNPDQSRPDHRQHMNMLVAVHEGRGLAVNLQESVELPLDLPSDLLGRQLALQGFWQECPQGRKNARRRELRHGAEGRSRGEIEVQAHRDPAFQGLQIAVQPGASRACWSWLPWPRDVPSRASSTMPRLTPSARPKSSAQRMTLRKEPMYALKFSFAAA